MTTPNKTVPVATGAEAFLAQMRALGSVRYMFANTGTDHGPLIEAMARTAGEDPRDIRPIVVPHELAAVSMAHGYYNVTHEPQMVLVHTLPGTANALGGVINAASVNVPLFLCAGRTPITEGELRGGKSQNIHWRQESRDQGSVVREFVKWDYEIRTNQNLAAVVSRAYKIAMSEPRGPVYMTLPREWLAEGMESTQVMPPDALAPASKSQADQGFHSNLVEPVRHLSRPSRYPAAPAALPDHLRRFVHRHRRGDGGVHDHCDDDAYPRRFTHRSYRPQTFSPLWHRVIHRRQIGLPLGAVDFAHAAVPCVARPWLVRLHYLGINDQRRHRAASAAR